MSSYLTILNDTPDEWVCSLGPDQAAAAIVGYIFTAVTTAAAIVLSAGALAPAAAVWANNAFQMVFFISPTALASITSAAASVTGVSIAKTGLGVLGAVVSLSISAAVKDGGVRITPGNSYRYGPMSLSLWQQAKCFNSKLINNGNAIQTQNLYMRPIFSGPLAGSTNTHQISFWINKWGTENVQVSYLNNPATGAIISGSTPIPNGNITMNSIANTVWSPAYSDADAQKMGLANRDAAGFKWCYQNGFESVDPKGFKDAGNYKYQFQCVRNSNKPWGPCYRDEDARAINLANRDAAGLAWCKSNGYTKTINYMDCGNWYFKFCCA